MLSKYTSDAYRPLDDKLNTSDSLPIFADFKVYGNPVEIGLKPNEYAGWLFSLRKPTVGVPEYKSV